MNELNEIWEKVLEIIEQRPDMPAATVNAFIKVLELVDFDGETLFFITDRSFAKTAVDKNYHKYIEDGFREIWGGDFKVQVDVVIKKPEPETFDTDEGIEQNTQDKLIARYTFDSFVVCDENRFAYENSIRVAENPGLESHNPMFLYGPSGIGKTHLMYSTYNKIKERKPHANIIVTTGEKFATELHTAINDKTQLSFHEKYHVADAIFIDDIQVMTRFGETAQDELFHCLDNLMMEHKQFFIVSDRPPKEIKTFTDRLRSRFERGTLQDIKPPDKDTRVAIIKKKCEENNIKIDNRHAEFIADKVKANVRQIEGIINKIVNYTRISHTSPDFEMLRSFVNEVTNDNQPSSVVIEKILHRVADDMEVSIEDIKSKKRDKKIKDARQICIYLIKSRTDLTLSEIGEPFGLSHSTVLHSINLIKKEREEKSSLDVLLNNIISDI